MQYVNLYAGPEFLMHFKYSAMLNIVYVTMMYGIALPILFLYAILGLLVLFISEKLLFFYTYRLPPSYDASLAKHVIGQMRFAPMIMMVFGYWFLSSNQLLENKIFMIQRASDTPLTGHTYGDFVYADGWGAPQWPLALMSIFMIIQAFFGGMIMKCLIQCFPSLEVGNEELDEDIDTYWNVLDDGDRKWSQSECTNFRGYANMNLEKFGMKQKSKDFKLLEEEEFQALMDSKSTGRTL
jgi:hypothetical protein